MVWDLSEAHTGGSDFKPIPPGDYDVVCEKAEVKTTKSGTGEYISCTFRVTTGDHQHRKIFATFNTKNQNPEAVSIGLGQIKAFLECAGVPNPNKLSDVSELCGLRAVAHVKIKTDATYGDKNVINYFKPKSKVSTGADSLMAEDFTF